MGRFEYVKYTDKANALSQEFKNLFSDLERKVANDLTCPRSKALVLTKLEEAFMWVGKALRNDQLEAEKREKTLIDGRN